MLNNTTLFLIFVTLTSVTAQTIQYSVGWTNGKRDGHRREDPREAAATLERILSPCQIIKLRYVLEGKPIQVKLFVPCDYTSDDSESPKRYKPDRNQDTLFEVFQ